jgi:hypothetical protein
MNRKFTNVNRPEKAFAWKENLDITEINTKGNPINIETAPNL